MGFFKSNSVKNYVYVLSNLLKFGAASKSNND